jgi:Zn-dependent protease
VDFSFNQRSGQEIIAFLLSFVIATTIHELMHALVASRMGDNTAREQGRITLNPLSHFEPFGFFGMVMISIGIPFIGWGKPVPVNPGRFSHRFARHRKHGMALVAAAGPLSNVAQALLMAIPYQYVIRNNVNVNEDLWTFMTIFIWVNVLLASFNMIPIPPLDGNKILLGILPDFWRPILQPLEQYGFMILLLIFFIGGQLGDSLVDGIMVPVRSLIMDAVNLGL